jgi:hypothetical protein
LPLLSAADAMTRPRKVNLAIEPDMFGFDPIGADYLCTAEERELLQGLSLLATALYFRCLKPFTKGDGRVYAASYYRLAQILTHHRRHGRGTLFETPTEKQLRGALDDLIDAKLAKRSSSFNEQRGVLQIWLTHGVRGTANRDYRAGNGAGSRRPARRASA